MDPTNKRDAATRRSLLHRALAPLLDSTASIAAMALATLGVLAYLDRLSSMQLSLTPLYLIPVAVVAWYIGRASGRVYAFVAGGAQAIADLTSIGGAPHPAVIAWNAVMIVMLSFVIGEVLTRLHTSLAIEHDLARTDPLTGVANTRSFHELAAAELERSRRYGRTFTIACLDLDHFKTVNDTLGHATGDRLLRDVGLVLRSHLRRVDVVARLGGDEFTILLPETAADPASVALEHVHVALESLTEAYGPEVKASIGAVTFTAAPDSVGEMVRIADTTMYHAKARGRDRVEAITLPRDVDLLEEFELVALRAFAPHAAMPARRPVPSVEAAAEPID
jgi:diguanylate cyclase (GGDEF)-like protein